MTQRILSYRSGAAPGRRAYPGQVSGILMRRRRRPRSQHRLC